MIEDDSDDSAAIAEPSLDGIIEQMMSGGFFASGWGGIDNAGAAMAKNRDELRRAFQAENAAVYRTFRTEDGRKVLDLLLRWTLRRSAWPAEMHFPMEVLTAIGIAREGQNALVAALIEAYAAAIGRETQSRTAEP